MHSESESINIQSDRSERISIDRGTLKSIDYCVKLIETN